MLVSEVIKKLETLKEKHGDLPVVVHCELFVKPPIKECAPAIYYDESGATDSEGKIVESLTIF